MKKFDHYATSVTTLTTGNNIVGFTIDIVQQCSCGFTSINNKKFVKHIVEKNK